MTGVGDRPRTFDEYVRVTNKRLVSLERDLTRAGAVGLEGRVLPGPGVQIEGAGSVSDPFVIGVDPRLQALGAQITDWNAVKEVGFYWALSSAANGPGAFGVVGQVFAYPDLGRIVQETRRISMTEADMQLTFRRVYSGTAWSAWTILHAPYAMASGVTPSSGAAGGSTAPIFWDGTTTITFPAGRFTQPPLVTLEVVAGSNVVWVSISTAPTTVQVIARLMRVGAAPVAATPIHWHAIQMLPGSAAG